MTATALDLRQHLARKFPDAIPLPGRRGDGVSTGVERFDNLLPNNGLPQGRATVWSAPAHAATALLAATCQSVSQSGLRAAWVDGAQTLGPGWESGAFVLRPRTPLLGLRFAELLLMSGGFALVVLSGIPVERHALFRLGRAVHEGGGAFAVIADTSIPAPLRLSSQYLPEKFEYARSPFGTPAQLQRVALKIDAQASGWSRSTTLTLPVESHDVRRALDPGLADRRGGE